MTTCDLRGARLAPLLLVPAFVTGACSAPHGSGATRASVAALFAAPNAWTRDVSALPASPSSAASIASLASLGGWGTGELRIDFSMNVLHADASTPRVAFDPTSNFYVPDCDHVPFPVPAGGALEGESGYACTHGGDCHLLVVSDSDARLYEMWQADLSDGVFRGGCAAVWQLDESYGPDLRGEDCTSADAGGFPVAAMLFSPDEVVAGSIDHAIRFILPNDRIRHGVFVRPATHTTGATSAGDDALPYGARLRLRASYPVDQLSPGAQVVARALQRYGMILADGGNIALTAESDRFTRHTWAEVGVDALSLASIAVTDMEVVDLDDPIPYDGNCVRVP